MNIFPIVIRAASAISLMIKTTLGLGVIIVATTSVVAAPAEFVEEDAMIVAEAEAATALQEAEVITRDDASGGRVVRWTGSNGRAEFTLRVSTPGTWYFWVRTAAADHSNNGLYLELDGKRLSAPEGHPMGRTPSVYLRKHPQAYSWKPEWQGPGEGRHEGPIAIALPRAGIFRLAILARSSERPVIDKVVLTLSRAPAFVDDGALFGPPAGKRPTQ